MSTKQDNIKKTIELPVMKSGTSSSKNKFWKSLNFMENSNSKEVKKAINNEFSDGVTDDFNIDELEPSSRRKFLALMSASSAFAAVACTDYRDKGEIIPYNNKPEGVFPGIANYYASTYTENGRGWGLLVKTREGRPIKLEGNPDHPINQGKLNAVAQSSILGLYDPTRLQSPMKKSGEKFVKSNWDTVDSEIKSDLSSASSAGKEIVLLTNTLFSPTFSSVLNDFKTKYPTTKIVSYELFNENNKLEAWKSCYGNENLPIINLDKAKVILSLDCDFLATDGDEVENARMYASAKDVNNLESYSRLYSIEAAMSLTGQNADYRMRLTPELQYDLVLSLINAVIKKGINADSSVASKVSGYNLEKFVSENGLSEIATNQLVADLIHHKGSSIVLAGQTLTTEVHIAVNLLNDILGNSALYSKENSRVSYNSIANNNDLKSLVSMMNSGKVGVLLNLDTNPVYHFAKELNFENALKNVNTVVSISEFENETTKLSSYILPANNNLESWSDAKVRTGIFSLGQPIIAPLYDTRQKESILLTYISNEKYTNEIYHTYLMSHWETKVYASANVASDFKTFWLSCLHDGVLKTKEAVTSLGKLNSSSFVSSKNTLSKNGFTLILKPSHFIGDGRYANNGWLQELPHPVSKITWDNYAALAPKTAKKLGVDTFGQIEVSLGDKKVTLPVIIQPGNAEDTISVELGYGRTVVGEVGTNVGVNVNIFLSSNSSSNWILIGANAKLVEGAYKMASVQEHHALDEKSGMLDIKDLHLKREIIQESSVVEYKANPNVIRHHQSEVTSITSAVAYPGVKWAMAIDMNKCTGCATCTASCNVENNIPVVGKDQVSRGREMSWIRIDRYYAGTPEEPIASNQPILCQHCDNAPCENVCPVVATTHSADGLNQMAYNRCVGTRYCANNCPYKVRRYNFYDFRDNLLDGYYYKESVNLIHNPEVTVRSRGVMEKCTFCIQRISEERQHAREQGRAIKGSNVITACQEACPTSAIYFGDANDKDSVIAKLREHDLGYHVLAEINVKPNVTYLAKLRNVQTEGAHSEHH
ncbi:MAG: 4Fe-4S dicluster domain-containing protein [Candidatus Kapabacteria bacterium]|nr:4Fe-4S dicluster domain-containing protein [Candidatus Kapabacteria bacterium]